MGVSGRIESFAGPAQDVFARISHNARFVAETADRRADDLVVAVPDVVLL